MLEKSLAEDELAPFVRHVRNPSERGADPCKGHSPRRRIQNQHRQGKLQQRADHHHSQRKKPFLFAQKPRQTNHREITAKTNAAFCDQAHRAPMTSTAALMSDSAAAAVGASAMIRTIGSVLLPRTINQRSGQSSRSPSSRSARASAKRLCTASSAAGSFSTASVAVRLTI